MCYITWFPNIRVHITYIPKMSSRNAELLFPWIWLSPLLRISNFQPLTHVVGFLKSFPMTWNFQKRYQLLPGGMQNLLVLSSHIPVWSTKFLTQWLSEVFKIQCSNPKFLKSQQVKFIYTLSLDFFPFIPFFIPKAIKQWPLLFTHSLCGLYFHHFLPDSFT